MATQNIHRPAADSNSICPDSSAPPKNGFFGTCPGSTQTPIGLPGANTEPVSTASVPEPPPPVQIPDIRDVRFLTAFGQLDTHALVSREGKTNTRSVAGTPYQGVSWDEILRLVETPSATEKGDAQFFIPSTYRGFDGRYHDVQRERGSFRCLTVDIDSGNHDIDTIVDAVTATTPGTSAVVYSSSSSKPDSRKWRVLIPLATPVSGDDFPDTELALFSLLAAYGVSADPTLSRVGQPVYLPNVPPNKRDEYGRPLFYQWRKLAGDVLVLDDTSTIITARDRLRFDRETEKAESARRASERRARHLAHVKATGDDFEPIRHFNDSHTVAQMLAHYGFEQDPSGRPDYKSPLSSSGSYSTQDRGDHWVSVSAWGHTHNVGRRTASGNRCGSAFDLYVFFEHGGDVREAARAYAQEVRPQKPTSSSLAVPDVQDPAKPCRIEPLVDQGEEVELDDYRREMRSRLADWFDAANPRGRTAILAAPAGTGKTTAVDALALPHYDRVAFGIPTHANKAERLSSLISLPILEESDVAAFPRLDAETCQSFTDEQAEDLRARGNKKATSAQRAQTLGFGVRGTACRGCPLAPWRELPPKPDADLAQWTGEDGGGLDNIRTSTAEPVDQFSDIQCRYWREVARAEAAAIKVATLDRIARTAQTIFGRDAGRSLLVLDERALETVAPVVDVSVVKLELLVQALEGAALRLTEARDRDEGNFEAVEKPDRIRELLRGPEKGPKRKPVATKRSPRKKIDPKRADQIEYVSQLAAVAHDIARRLREKAAARTFGFYPVCVLRDNKKTRKLLDNNNGWYPDTLVVRGRVVKSPAKLLADVLERSLPPDAIVDARALDLVRRVHGLKTDLLVLSVQELDGGETSNVPAADRRVSSSVQGTWTVRLPKAADVLFLDGTADTTVLAMRLGTQAIENLTPPSRLRRQAPARQLARDLHRGSSLSTVARTLEQALQAMPKCQRVGIIMLACHRDKLFPRDRDGNDIRTDESRELVPDHVLRRIARDPSGRLLVEHYGGGRDRASNDWIRDADGLVLLGTPRPSSSAVVGELVRRLDVDALRRGSAWGDVLWDAQTTDGRVVRCKGRGYLDAAWAEAAAACTRVALRQALERARTVLAVSDDSSEGPGGIPVLVVSAEGGLGLPVLESLPEPVSRGARKVAAVVERLIRDAAGTDNPGPDCETREDGCPTGGGPACAVGSIGERLLLIGRIAQDGPPPPSSRLVLSALLEEPSRKGGTINVRQARTWIAEALAVGLIVSEGRTTSVRYGLPVPVEVGPPTSGFSQLGISGSEPVSETLRETPVSDPSWEPKPEDDPFQRLAVALGPDWRDDWGNDLEAYRQGGWTPYPDRPLDPPPRVSYSREDEPSANPRRLPSVQQKTGRPRRWLGVDVAGTNKRETSRQTTTPKGLPIGPTEPSG
jgi:hypothetical protein